MILIAIDLEFNQPSQKIIEIGACAFDTNKKEILESISIIVDPEEEINPYITTLTTITQEQVNKGITLLEGYKLLTAFKEKHQGHRMLVQWGGGDDWHLKAELEEQYGGVIWEFGRTSMNAKNVYQTYQLAKGIKMQSGLAKSMTKLGLAFKGTKHRAIDDATNTAILYLELLNRLCVR